MALASCGVAHSTTFCVGESKDVESRTSEEPSVALVPGVSND